MLYTIERFDLHPAAPSTRDHVVEVVQESLLPAQARLGARLVGAFFAHEEWYDQVLHVTEFDDFAAYGAYRRDAPSDPDAARAAARMAELAPGRQLDFLEPLGPISTGKLHEAIAASADEPVGVYTFAILEVTEGRMDDFAHLLDAAQANLPIAACWRDVSGNPNRVTDLWRADTGRAGYRPNDPGQEAFFGPLREIAPKERMMRLHALPYSPLR